jgi:hypothetical protein
MRAATIEPFSLCLGETLVDGASLNEVGSRSIFVARDQRGLCCGIARGSLSALAATVRAVRLGNYHLLPAALMI